LPWKWTTTGFISNIKEQNEAEVTNWFNLGASSYLSLLT
jgi:hypothetical protein